MNNQNIPLQEVISLYGVGLDILSIINLKFRTHYSQALRR